MTRRLYKLITAIIFFWIAVFIFQKEVLAFIGGLGPSWIKDVLLQIVNFMVLWAGRGWDIVKVVFNYLVSLVARIISNANPLYGLVKGLVGLVSKIINFIVGLLSPILGKFFGG